MMLDDQNSPRNMNFVNLQVQMSTALQFPKPQVACSIHAGGANETSVKALSD
jgi:hypothetical protein